MNIIEVNDEALRRLNQVCIGSGHENFSETILGLWGTTEIMADQIDELRKKAKKIEEVLEYLEVEIRNEEKQIARLDDFVRDRKGFHPLSESDYLRALKRVKKFILEGTDG